MYHPLIITGRCGGANIIIDGAIGSVNPGSACFPTPLLTSTRFPGERGYPGRRDALILPFPSLMSCRIISAVPIFIRKINHLVELNNSEVSVVWYYEIDDEDIHETALQYKEICKAKFDIIGTHHRLIE